MARKSTIDKLPEAIRIEIGKLNQVGWTIDEILEHLRGLLDKAPSRSALGRHLQRVERTAERLRRTRQIAEAVTSSMGDAPESRAAQVNIELLHSIIFDLFTVGDGEASDDAEGKPSFGGDPEAIAQIAKAMADVARASKTNVDFVAAVEKRAAEKARREALSAAADAAVTTASEAGMSAETAARMRREILGLRPPTATASA